jgi:hypothetical protein
MAKKRLAAKQLERKVQAVREKIMTPYQAKDYTATVAAIDEATKNDEQLAAEFASTKFAALCLGGEVEQGLEVGKKLVKNKWDDAGALNELCWNVIDPDLSKEPDPRVAQLALKAAQRAVELTKTEDLNVLDTLAEALFRTGDVDGAISTEQKVIELAQAKVKDSASPALNSFRERLERYRKAAKKAD